MALRVHHSGIDLAKPKRSTRKDMRDSEGNLPVKVQRRYIIKVWPVDEATYPKGNRTSSMSRPADSICFSLHSQGDDFAEVEALYQLARKNGWS